MCIQGVLVFADHAQSSPVVTLNVPVVPFDSTVARVGRMVALQLFFVVPAAAGAPLSDSASCFTVTVFPATCIVPVRGAPVLFAGTLYCTVPLPEPLAVIIWIQPALVVAVQGQFALLELRVSLSGGEEAPRGSDESDPCQATETLTGETETEQAPAYSWFIVTIFPSTFIVPVRGFPDVFCNTLYSTYPLPVPLRVKTLIQGAFPSASQRQPALLVVTASLAGGPETPPRGSEGASGAPCSRTETLVGDTDTTLQTVSESCWIVTVFPATCMVPVRGVPVVFCVTLYCTVPLPAPPDDRSWIHEAPDDALQLHSALLAVTLILGGRDEAPRGSFGSGKPFTGAVAFAGDTEKVQACAPAPSTAQRTKAHKAIRQAENIVALFGPIIISLEWIRLFFSMVKRRRAIVNKKEGGHGWLDDFVLKFRYN